MLFNNLEKTERTPFAPVTDMGIELPDFWTNERLYEFIRTSNSGMYWIYNKSRMRLEEKCYRYKRHICSSDNEDYSLSVDKQLEVFHATEGTYEEKWAEVKRWRVQDATATIEDLVADSMISDIINEAK